MRLIDADELLEHAYRDRLDSRELIVKMIANAPTVEGRQTTEINHKIVNVSYSPYTIDSTVKSYSRTIQQTAEWIEREYDWKCSNCHTSSEDMRDGPWYYCPHCGSKMEG